MKYKIFLTDFDGTIVSKDILDVICGIVGKEEESRKLNEAFIAGEREGLQTLVERINFLKGVSVKDIYTKLDQNNYLLPGAKELFSFLRDRGIITVLHSGNILPVLSYYKDILDIDYILGTNPKMNQDCILGIDITDLPGKNFKLKWCKKIIKDHNLTKRNVIAMGDAPSDIPIFKIAEKSICVNSKCGADKFADYSLDNSLLEAIPILESIL